MYSVNLKQPIACAVDRQKAIGYEPLRDSAFSLPEINLVDLTNFFCDQYKCYAGVGGVQIYYDTTHISGIYSQALAPYLEKQLKPVHKKP